MSCFSNVEHWLCALFYLPKEAHIWSGGSTDLPGSERFSEQKFALVNNLLLVIIARNSICDARPFLLLGTPGGIFPLSCLWLYMGTAIQVTRPHCPGCPFYMLSSVFAVAITLSTVVIQPFLVVTDQTNAFLHLLHSVSHKNNRSKVPKTRVPKISLAE